jgi:hypothetical protein
MVLDLDPRPEHERWLSAASRVLVRTDRILAGRDDIGFHLSDYGLAPAWSDGTNITIRTKDWERSWEDEGAVARLLGLNYHELAHILLTPRIKELETARLQTVYNLADDNRIETLFTALYTPSIPFFTQAVLDLIVADGTNADTLHVLVAGRKYLSRKIRKAAARAYRGDAAEWQALIDEYLLIDWAIDRQRGIELVELMADHLYASQVRPPEGCGTSTTRGTETDEADEARERVAEQMEDEAAQDEAEQEQAEADRPEADEAEAPEASAPEANDTDEAEADSPAQDEPTASDGDQAEGEPEAEGQSEAEGDEADTDQPADGASSAEAESEIDDLTEALDEAKAEADQAVDTEAARIAEQIEMELDQPSGEMGESLPRWEDRVPVTEAAQVAAEGLKGVLAELMAAVDPGWESHRDTGRLNVGRFMKREAWEPLDELFDEWHPGVNDAMDIEVAILVDTSSSMGSDGRAFQVAEASWALKAALGSFGLPVAVMGYDSNSTLIYGESDEADPGYMPAPLWRESTEPAEVLIEAGSHFQYSSHKRRILVALTDGAWVGQPKLRGNPTNYGDIVASIDAELRVLLRFGGGAANPGGFDEVHDVESMDTLVDVVREAIVVGVARAGGRESW